MQLQKVHFRISMGRVGCPQDNAVAERVNGILKGEFFIDRTFDSFALARRATADAIDIYNNERPSSSAKCSVAVRPLLHAQAGIPPPVTLQRRDCSARRQPFGNQLFGGIRGQGRPRSFNGEVIQRSLSRAGPHKSQILQPAPKLRMYLLLRHTTTAFPRRKQSKR